MKHSVSLPSVAAGFDLKDLVSRFVDDSLTAERRESLVNQVIRPSRLVNSRFQGHPKLYWEK